MFFFFNFTNFSLHGSHQDKENGSKMQKLSHIQQKIPNEMDLCGKYLLKTRQT